MSDAEQIEGIARAIARGQGHNYDTLYAGPKANIDHDAKSAYHHMIDAARAAADQIATEALRERAIGAASKALAWLETEPHGDLAANSARAGLIAGQAAVNAAAAILAGRAEALRELLDEALLWVPGHVHAHFLERRSAALADTPAPGWREYTVEPDVPDGVMVLCRSEEACEGHIPNPADRHLTLGEAADWAQAHAARHHHEEAAARAELAKTRRELEQTKAQRNLAADWLEDSAEVERDRDAAREELDKTRAELERLRAVPGVAALDAPICSCRPNAAALHLKDCPVWVNIGPNLARRQYVRRDSLASPATTAEPADEPKATCHLPVQNGEPCGLLTCRKHGCRVAPHAEPAAS